MDYKIFLAENDKIIVCKVLGPMTADTALRFGKEMDALSREKDIKRFLIDVRGAPNVSDAFENYHFANKDMVELNFKKDVRVGMLADADDDTHNFVETATRNAGFNVRIFNREADAISWLKKGMLGS